MTASPLGSVDDLVARALAVHARTQEARLGSSQGVATAAGSPPVPARTLIGVAGEPGGGKSTAAAAVVDGLTRVGVRSVVVPMDGFHLAGSSLGRLGRLDRKGAIDTFDADGYLALLDRLRSRSTTVWAPEYVRGVEESIGGAIEVDPSVEVVVSEGNYLLAELAPWPEVRSAFDEVWFVDTPAELRRRWLVARHVRFGMTSEAAAAWAAGPDEANARLVRATGARADVVVDAGRLWPDA
ncbi:nucleoside/nucleotide kinase family protein [Frigoribacterium sp. PhB24]|uniref:nucleoside/nucleotide kinase family protein n=1 Tax=Frigoribacterium sp. PhB24 TaxID=2485204 RepID=UPI000F47AAAB|nr:nucleoside/nucleotide kinase family protein [Frigoribacterium sp. PhB24]ROS52731.1 pantothenate kinase [Frigoribacterium sp. PhB24]